MKPFYSHYCDTRSRNAPPSASGRVLHTPPVRSHAPTLRVPVRAFLPERVPPRRGSQSPPAREITHEAAVCAWREVDRREDRSEEASPQQSRSKRQSCTCSLRLRHSLPHAASSVFSALPQQNAHVVESVSRDVSHGLPPPVRRPGRNGRGAVSSSRRKRESARRLAQRRKTLE